MSNCPWYSRTRYKQTYRGNRQLSLHLEIGEETNEDARAQAHHGVKGVGKRDARCWGIGVAARRGAQQGSTVLVVRANMVLRAVIRTMTMMA